MITIKILREEKTSKIPFDNGFGKSIRKVPWPGWGMSGRYLHDSKLIELDAHKLTQTSGY
jgi:hypothetical protein